jgi:hypothetical protein
MMKRILIFLAFSVGVFAQGQGVQTAIISSPAPTGVQQQFVATTGVTGQTFYCYWVVAVYNIGMGTPQANACLSSANATLSSGNYNTISWSAAGSGVIGYWVVRAASTVFPGSGTVAVNSTVLANTTFSQTDQSNTLNSFTFAPVGQATYQFVLNNKDFGLPIMQIQDIIGNVQYQWQMNGNVRHKIEAVEGNLTVAALHAKPIIVPAILGETIRVEAFQFEALGSNTATCTGITVQDTSAGNIVAVSATAAALTANTVVTEYTPSGVTLTTFWSSLTPGAGLQLTDGGTQCTGATSFNYRVFYKVLP